MRDFEAAGFPIVSRRTFEHKGKIVDEVIVSGSKPKQHGGWEIYYKLMWAMSPFTQEQVDGVDNPIAHTQYPPDAEGVMLDIARRSVQHAFDTYWKLT